MAVAQPMNPTITRTPLLVLDTETTGPEESEALIVEIGGAFFLGGQRIGPRLNQRVNPDVPIPAGASEVHGIYDADVADAPTFAEIVPRFERLLSGSTLWAHCSDDLREFGYKGPTAPLLAGYNAQKYDSVVINRALEAAGSKRRLDADAMIDPIWAARWAWPDASARLEAVCRRYGITIPSAHAAWGDSEATGYLIAAMIADGLIADDLVEAYQEQEHRKALDQADRQRWGHYIYTGRDDGETLYVGFGKHRGTPLAEIDPGFVQWMRGRGDFPEHVMEMFEGAVR